MQGPAGKSKVFTNYINLQTLIFLVGPVVISVSLQAITISDSHTTCFCIFSHLTHTAILDLTVLMSSELTVHTARVFRRDSPGRDEQWLARSIRESWGVLWLVIRLLSERTDVSTSVIKALRTPVLHSPPRLSACWSSTHHYPYFSYSASEHCHI
jgi:hypothetical protein